MFMKYTTTKKESKIFLSFFFITYYWLYLGILLLNSSLTNQRTEICKIIRIIMKRNLTPTAFLFLVVCVAVSSFFPTTIQKGRL